MTTIKIGRWLLVALAIVGLTMAAPAVSAHGTETTAHGGSPFDGPADERTTDEWTADEWTAWMQSQMTRHMGPGAVEWMESHMGVSVEQMGQFMADGNHRGPGMTARGGMAGNGGTYGGGMYGSGGTYGGGMTGPGGMYGAGHGC